MSKIVNIVQIVKKWEFPIRPVVTEILTLYAQVVTTHVLVLSSCNLTLKKVRVRARRSFDRTKQNRFQPRDGGGKQWQERSPNQAKAASRAEQEGRGNSIVKNSKQSRPVLEDMGPFCWAFLVDTLIFVVELLLYDQAWFCVNFLSDTVDTV